MSPDKNIDKKILKYLAEKDKASESTVIDETFKDFSLTREEYAEHLKSLQNRDLLRYERPFGSGASLYITEKGRFLIKPFSQKITQYVEGHLLEILTLLITALTLWIALSANLQG